MGEIIIPIHPLKEPNSTNNFKEIGSVLGNIDFIRCIKLRSV